MNRRLMITRYEAIQRNCRAVGKRVRQGTLKKPTYCELCLGGGDLQAHHVSYALKNRFKIVWLCAPCHRSVTGRHVKKVNQWKVRFEESDLIALKYSTSISSPLETPRHIYGYYWGTKRLWDPAIDRKKKVDIECWIRTLIDPFELLPDETLIRDSLELSSSTFAEGLNSEF